MENTNHTVYVDEWLWDRMAEEPAVKPRLELVSGTGASAGELAARGGMHDAAVLARLLASDKPFTGIVMSIGVNADSNDDLLRSVTNFIVELLRDADLACRMAKHEFLIICPGEHGATAQHRLADISTHLWQYQLRAAGTSSILFHWGAVPARRERLVDAIAGATERMDENRRTRENIFWSLSHRKAV